MFAGKPIWLLSYGYWILMIAISSAIAVIG